jgi:glycosyltransferase involved in cell wall biosynthesis
MTLLEAMASANTIVASNLPSIAEVLGSAGTYFAPGETGELASALLQALNDRELRNEKGRLARQTVEERFCWRVVLPMLEDLYREVVA